MTKLKRITLFILATCMIWSLSDINNTALAKRRKKKKNKVETIQRETQPSETTETSNGQTNNNNEANVQAALNQVLPLDPEVIHGSLPNGMQYFIRKNAKPANRMELRLAVDAGSIQEDDDQKGLAHFLEHMEFNGSEHFKKNDLVNYVESIGVKFGPHLNAYTSFDETVYMLQTPTDRQGIIDTALLILKDWANGATLSKEEIDKEKGVVLSEWRSSLGPQQRMQNQFFPTLFKGSRYPDRLPIGDTSIIKGANQALLSRFYKDWYRPDLMSIILVGDFDPQKMEDEVVNIFSQIHASKNERKKEIYPVPPHKETLVKVVTDKEAPYTQVILFEKHPADLNNTVIGYRDYIKQQLINTMLNERYKAILQKPNPPFFYAGSNYGRQLRDLDAFTSVAVGSADHTHDMLKTLFEESFRASKFGFTPGEFDRAKADLLNSYATALKEKDKTESRVYANELVGYYLSDEAAPGITLEDQLVNVLIPTISLNEINETTKKLISHDNTVIVITAPEKDKALLPKDDQILTLRQEVAESDLKPVVDQVVNTKLLEQEPKGGKIVKVEKDTKYQTETWTLSNGAKVIIKPTNFKNDEILVQAFSPGGSSLYSDDDFQTIANTSDIVNESGFGDFDALTLNKALAGKTVHASPFISEIEEGIVASASPKDFKTLMQLLYLDFTSPRKDSSIFQSYVNKNKALYSNLLANPVVYYQKTILETLYNNNIRRNFPQAKDFDQIDFEKIIPFYKERFGNAADFQFVIVGNVDSVDLKNLVETYIASLPSVPSKKEQFKNRNITISKGKITKEVNMGAAPKTNVSYTYSGQEAWSKDKETLLNILIGVLEIKLRESLREDKGGVYGVAVQGDFQRIPTPEYFTMISYNVDPPKKDEIGTAAMEVIKNLKAQNVDLATLNKVKEKTKREVETELKENSYWAKTLKTAATFNEPIDDTNTFLEKVEAITPDQIKEAAQKYLSGDNLIEIVMEPNK